MNNNDNFDELIQNNKIFVKDNSLTDKEIKKLKHDANFFILKILSSKKLYRKTIQI